MLRPFTVDDEPAARAAHVRLAQDGVDFCLGLDAAGSWTGWLDQGELLRSGVVTDPRWVPETMLGAFVGPVLVGRLSVRHDLNELLAHVGGHLGYVVLPEHRRRGYGTAIMSGALQLTHELGLERVLVTCSDDNVASVRIIESAGGVLENVVPHPASGGRKRRYWIAPGDSRPSAAMRLG